MPRHFLSLLIFLPVMAVAALGHADELSLQGVSELKVVGPVQVHLAHSDYDRIEYEGGQLESTRDGAMVTITASEPSFVMVSASMLNKLEVVEGSVLIMVEGHQRLSLAQVTAPEIKLQLHEQGRFDSDRVTADHLHVVLSGLGKASLDYVEADLFELEMTDHGDMDISGKTREQQVALSGYARYDAETLNSEDATVALDDYASGLIRATNVPLINAAPYTLLSAR